MVKTAYTMITIDQAVDNLEKYFDYEIKDTGYPNKKILEYQTNYENISWDFYNCYKDYSEKGTIAFSETVVVENGSCTLSHYPSVISSITTITSFEGSLNNAFSISGNSIIFETLKTGIINVSYKYDVERVYLLYADNIKQWVENGEALSAVYVKNPTELSELIEVTFTVDTPTLSTEVDSEKVIAYSIMSRDKRMLSMSFYGANQTKYEPSFEEKEEIITFTDGVGNTQFAIASLIKYEYVSGSKGRIRKVALSEYFDNYLSLDTGLDGVYKITYSTPIDRFYYSLTEESGTYKLTDSIENTVTGELVSDAAGTKKDISIKVVDYLTQQPLAGARVEVAGVVSTTGDDGVAYLKAVPVGLQRVVIHKEGYIDNISDNLANEYINV